MGRNIPAVTATVAFVAPIAGHIVALPFLAYFHLITTFRYYLLMQFSWSILAGSLLCRANRGNQFRNSITIRSIILGALWSLGAQLVLLNQFQSKTSLILPLGLYAMTLSFYCITEFLSIALKNPASVKLGDFMISYDYSKDRPDGMFISRLAAWVSSITYTGFEYHMDFLIPFVGFCFESWYFPESKLSQPWICYAGFVVCFAGEVIRKGAMLTAGKNFNHVVQEKRAQDHVLVTEGIYGWWRHPSYVGYYSWHLGHQIILVSPVIFVCRAVLHWFYMKQRIAREEEKLVEFFGPQYLEYKKRVPSGIPFIE